MFGIGLWEVVIIVLVALLVLGPEKLPDVARQVGRGLRELRRATNDLQASLNETIYMDEADAKAAAAKGGAPAIRPAAGIEPHMPGPGSSPSGSGVGPQEIVSAAADAAEAAGHQRKAGSSAAADVADAAGAHHAGGPVTAVATAAVGADSPKKSVASSGKQS